MFTLALFGKAINWQVYHVSILFFSLLSIFPGSAPPHLLRWGLTQERVWPKIKVYKTLVPHSDKVERLVLLNNIVYNPRLTWLFLFVALTGRPPAEGCAILAIERILGIMALNEVLEFDSP